jgi:hypothetical protein
MKTITCKEMGGACDTAFSGNTPEEVMQLGGKHLMSTTDQAHQSAREMMISMPPGSEGANKWIEWFMTVWEKAPEK